MYTVFSVHCIVYSVQCTVYSVQCVILSIQFKVCCVKSIWDIVQLNEIGCNRMEYDGIGWNRHK